MALSGGLIRHGADAYAVGCINLKRQELAIGVAVLREIQRHASERPSRPKKYPGRITTLGRRGGHRGFQPLLYRLGG